MHLRIRTAGAAMASVLVAAYGTSACSSGVDANVLEDDTVGTPAETTVVARNLDAPWDVEFLAGGDVLVTERRGRLVRLGPDGTRRWSVPVEGVAPRGEGGLLGMALHPAFTENRWIYLYFTAADENRILRYRLGDDGELQDAAVMVDGIPAANFHDGGRIAFGPDGFLYATTGDAGRQDRAQDPEFLGGKILRMTDTGAPAPGNPFGGYVHTMGHRNPQGITWAADGTMWATEHGRSGAQSGLDELNRIVPGGNYGWPDVQGSETAEGIESPVIHSGPDVTWAPAGMAWVDGSIFFTGLRGRALYEAVPQGGTATLIAHLQGELGRLRDVSLGPDGMLWILTNNTDGRGDPLEGDDKLLRVDPAGLERGG